MDLGRRLRELSEHRNMSQGDIEHKTGLLRCYISRVENGHTVPVIETLEKMVRALDVPLYALLYEHKGEAKTDEEEDELSDWASQGNPDRATGRQILANLNPVAVRFDVIHFSGVTIVNVSWSWVGPSVLVDVADKFHCDFLVLIP